MEDIINNPGVMGVLIDTKRKVEIPFMGVKKGRRHNTYYLFERESWMYMLFGLLRKIKVGRYNERYVAAQMCGYCKGSIFFIGDILKTKDGDYGRITPQGEYLSYTGGGAGQIDNWECIRIAHESLMTDELWTLVSVAADKALKDNEAYARG